MRILINDFGGYAFPIQLSKYLSNQGYEIVHTYVSNIKTPHGNMEKDKDSKNLTICPIILKTEFKKYSIIGRLKGELEFAANVNQVINTFMPDIILSANTPLLAQSIIQNKTRKLNIKFIYWCQDIHSIALEGYLSKKLSFVGKWISFYIKSLELKLLKRSNHVITISNNFNAIFKKWGFSSNSISVIHNWGPINEISIQPKINSWSEHLGIESKLVILYSGTLGIKHNPLLISNLAQKFKGNKNLIFVVITEGLGSEILNKQKVLFELDNLLILPFQDYQDLPKVLGSADILLSILEEDAALFSVPSKVLTYLCARKALMLSVPIENLSAKIVKEQNAGYCLDPNDNDGFMNKFTELINNPILREEMGINGRKYAESNFEISLIADKFIQIFNSIK